MTVRIGSEPEGFARFLQGLPEQIGVGIVFREGRPDFPWDASRRTPIRIWAPILKSVGPVRLCRDRVRKCDGDVLSRITRARARLPGSRAWDHRLLDAPGDLGRRGVICLQKRLHQQVAHLGQVDYDLLMAATFVGVSSRQFSVLLHAPHVLIAQLLCVEYAAFFHILGKKFGLAR